MTLCRSFVWRPILRNKGRNFAAPAESHDCPRFDAGVSFFHILEQWRHQWERLIGCSRSKHEVHDGLGLLWSLGGEICHVLRMVAPEVRHEDFELSCIIRCLRIARGEDVRSTQSLDVQAKDVVTKEDTAFGGG